jgi:dTDP-glucose pyrophosphorylase
MHPFSDSYPKPILPICNKPLITYQIQLMCSLGIKDIIILIGHKGFEITKVLGDGRQLGVRLRYIEQVSTLGIAHAVGRLESHIDRPFLLFLGDIFFVPGDLKAMFAMLEEQGGGAVLATKEETDPEAIRRNYSLALSADGFVTRVVEKPRHTTNRLKGVGIYLFDLPIFDAIRRTPRTAMRDEYEITDAIQVLIDDGYPVRPASVVVDDINLTYPSDLLRCNLMQARVTPAEHLISQNLIINKSASLQDCIIGDNVTIRNPIKISRSLIFENTCVTTQADLDGYIVTPEHLVDCRNTAQFAQGGLQAHGK